MVCIIGKVCPGLKNRTGAILSAAAALCFGGALIALAILSMLFTYLESVKKEGRRTEAEKEMIQCFYGAGFAIYGVWIMFTIVLLFGIVVENKRALGFWLMYTLIIPLYFVCGLIFLLASGSRISGWEIAYLVSQGVCIIALIWIGLAIWVYFGEIKQRDKNPELRVDEFVKRKENEIMFAQPFMGVLPPSGSYNPGYGGPAGGSLSSIPRSQKSRHTYAPTEAGESVRAGPAVPRQSRLDQYRSQHADSSPMKPDGPRQDERDGGTTYYRYQYTAEQQPNGSHHGSQASLGRGRPSAQPAPPYQPARYQRPAQQSPAQLYGSQGSLGGHQPYQTQHHASQGSIGGRQPYHPQHHASQGSLGGRPQHQLEPQQGQHGKDSEV